MHLLRSGQFVQSVVRLLYSFSGQGTLKRADELFKEQLCLLGALVIITLGKVFEARLFRFIQAEVGNKAGDVICLQCFQCFRRTVVSVRQDLFYLEAFRFVMVC